MQAARSDEDKGTMSTQRRRQRAMKRRRQLENAEHYIDAGQQDNTETDCVVLHCQQRVLCAVRRNLNVFMSTWAERGVSAAPTSKPYERATSQLGGPAVCMQQQTRKHQTSSRCQPASQLNVNLFNTQASIRHHSVCPESACAPA